MREASLEQPGEALLLFRLGLLAPEGGLADTCRAFEDARWVYDDRPAARAIWQDALKGLPATQALMQGLHGRGPVAFAGAHHFLARHGFARPDGTSAVRAFLQTLNSADIVAYSKRLQTVRIVVPIPEELAAVVRVVEPDRPYSNVLALREILRSCEDYIYWAEPHLPRRALEPLSYEADAERISEIRLLSGEQSVDDATRKDFKRFAAEMRNRSIRAEWRVVPTSERDWHDRYIVGSDQAWNVPPFNTLYKGDYSEASRTPTRPPFERWWGTGQPLGG